MLKFYPKYTPNKLKTHPNPIQQAIGWETQACCKHSELPVIEILTTATMCYCIVRLLIMLHFIDLVFQPFLEKGGVNILRA